MAGKNLCVVGSTRASISSSRLFPTGATTNKDYLHSSLDRLWKALCTPLEQGISGHRQTCELFLITSYLVHLVYRLVKWAREVILVAIGDGPS